MQPKKKTSKFREHILSKDCWCNPKVIDYGKVYPASQIRDEDIRRIHEAAEQRRAGWKKGGSTE